MEKFNTSNSQILKEIEKIIRNSELYNKLLKRAEYYLAYSCPHLKSIYEPEDIINNLCESLITGRRKWDKDKIDSLFVHMMSNIRSVVDNIRNLSEEKKVLEYDKYESKEEMYISAVDKSVPDKWKQEEESDLEEMKKNVQGFVEDMSIECQLVYHDILEGKTNKEIAEDLGVSVTEVENIKRTLKRHIAKQLQKIKY